MATPTGKQWEIIDMQEVIDSRIGNTVTQKTVDESYLIGGMMDVIWAALDRIEHQNDMPVTQEASSLNLTVEVIRTKWGFLHDDLEGTVMEHERTLKAKRDNGVAA